MVGCSEGVVDMAGGSDDGCPERDTGIDVGQQDGSVLV